MAKRKSKGDPYLDSRTAQFNGRVGDELLDEIRAVVDRTYADGNEDGYNEGIEAAEKERGGASTYDEERAFMERVAEQLRARERTATVEDTGGRILCVLVEHAGEDVPRRAVWHCGTAGETWGGTLVEEESGDYLERDFETEIPSDSEDAVAVAVALLQAIRLDEETPDAPEGYATRIARAIGEDARAVQGAGPDHPAYEDFVETTRRRVAHAFEEGYKAALVETGLAE